MDKTLPRILMTSDLHLGDPKAIDYDSRPFRDIDHQNKEIVKRFNSVIRPQDILYMLGDLGRGIFDVLHLINGTKVLCYGNHDHFGTSSALNRGFSAAIYSGSLRFGKNILTFSHCPLREVFREDVTGMRGAVSGENWHGESRHQMFSIPDYGQHHAHGHVHSKKGQAIMGRQLDVGVTAHDYFPVTQSYIEKWLHKSNRVLDGR
jgi:calcineurin-like phosphoesterase family protein